MDNAQAIADNSGGADRAAKPRRPWERLDGEGEQEFRAFSTYMTMAVDGEKARRSLRILAQEHPGIGSWATLARWSGRHHWGARCQAYDDWLAAEQAKVAARVHARRAVNWERRKVDYTDRTYKLAMKLTRLVERMLKHPIRKKVIHQTYDDGRPCRVEIKPANWTYDTPGRLLKISAELCEASRRIAMEDDEWRDFDPATASLEECKRFAEAWQARRDAFRRVRVIAAVKGGEVDPDPETAEGVEDSADV